MLDETDLILEKFQSAIKDIKDKQQLEKIKVDYLGKNGLITNEMRKISSAPYQFKKIIGIKINHLKNKVYKQIQSTKISIENKVLDKDLKTESIDVTLNGRNFQRGKIHPISHTINRVKHIFDSIGFKYLDGPDIENDWNNFTALNMPQHHPARQMHDTFYIEDSLNNKVTRLLRTHTSTVQIRGMLKNPPPLKLFSVGKVYRSDNDTTHSPMFHQFECLVVDKKTSLVDLKALLDIFLKLFFNTDNIITRYRTSYFPFTEPSFEVDIKCDASIIKCGKGSDWLEVLGCGMINTKVLENVRIDHHQYQGFALGIGIERLAMIKYNIPDLRSFFEGDLRWLEHYGF